MVVESVVTQSIVKCKVPFLMNLNKTSAWSESDVRSFLASSTIPMRIATSTASYPTRGKAVVTLSKDKALETLTTLMPRYLGGTESRLAKWLIGRSDEEYVLRLKPVQVTSWDYRERMS